MSIVESGPVTYPNYPPTQKLYNFYVMIYYLQGSVAYVSQQVWMQNSTLRNNITFGKPFNSRMYQKVIDSCALEADLEILPGGDMTEIGERVRIPSFF